MSAMQVCPAGLDLHSFEVDFEWPYMAAGIALEPTHATIWPYGVYLPQKDVAASATTMEVPTSLQSMQYTPRPAASEDKVGTVQIQAHLQLTRACMNSGGVHKSEHAHQLKIRSGLQLCRSESRKACTG